MNLQSRAGPIGAQDTVVIPVSFYLAVYIDDLSANVASSWNSRLPHSGVSASLITELVPSVPDKGVHESSIVLP